jgi:hypothetical protein
MSRLDIKPGYAIPIITLGEIIKSKAIIMKPMNILRLL